MLFTTMSCTMGTSIDGYKPFWLPACFVRKKLLCTRLPMLGLRGAKTLNQLSVVYLLSNNPTYIVLYDDHKSATLQTDIRTTYDDNTVLCTVRSSATKNSQMISEFSTNQSINIRLLKACQNSGPNNTQTRSSATA